MDICILLLLFYPIHKEKAYSDYWRFTDEGIRTLFKDLTEIWIRKMDSVILSVEDRNRYWDTRFNPSRVLCTI